MSGICKIFCEFYFSLGTSNLNNPEDRLPACDLQMSNGAINNTSHLLTYNGSNIIVQLHYIVISVSYTHLDVYKRQLLYSSVLVGASSMDVYFFWMDLVIFSSCPASTLSLSSIVSLSGTSSRAVSDLSLIHIF